MEWLAQYAEFGLVNEQKLALVFVREVGAIDNATYRQLDSSITHARARLEIHKLCDLGFIEKKGQGRNTYYIRTSKVVSLGERLRPQGERLLPQHGTLCERLLPQHGTLCERLLPLHGTLCERIPPQHGTLCERIPPQHGTLCERIPPQHGTLCEKIPPQHGTLGEKIPLQHGTLGEKIPPQHGTLGERYQGENERYQAFEERYQGVNREELLLLLPDDIKKRIDEGGKRVPKDVLNKLVVDMCSIVPLSMDDLSVLLHRNSKSFKNKNIKVLLENNQLFYWIPEMINHPQQKYVADPSMARSNSKKK